MSVRQMASMTIRDKMLPDVPPNALRTPISTVRSLTTIAMMLATPMAPASSVKPPMTQMKSRRPLKIRSNMAYSS